ncbi:hypothetical protein TNIN_194861 [Trichonephila inaurata madagascariensis]|uniref:Uncharacterized protein n=1 Tax=Trichonephila inaurata madagascariensis TaxID=2747483 RepID=A0A8X7C0I0_9ARAC|nr:hypothetical protein TNIN_194861 [Trichonephila inaurata madagascariensis]
MDYQNFFSHLLEGPPRTIPDQLRARRSQKADIRRFNSLLAQKRSPTQAFKRPGRHDPTFVERVKQRPYYENRQKSGEEGNFPYCDPPGSPIHKTPTL